MFWGAGAWNLSVAHEQLLGRAQRRMIRRMLRVKEEEKEHIEEFCMRTDHYITLAMRNFEVEPWVSAARRVEFSWAGKIMRQSVSNPCRLTAKAVAYLNLQNIYQFARKHRGWQGHACRLRLWRWGARPFQLLCNFMIFFAF